MKMVNIYTEICQSCA